MALECAHCGHRTPDNEATRCPSCLRSSTLVELPDAPVRVPLKQRIASVPRAVLAVGALALLGAVGGAAYYLRRPASPTASARAIDTDRLASRGVDRESLPPLYDLGSGSSSLADAARAVGPDPLARARAVGDRLAAMRRAARNTGPVDDAPPPARSLEITWLSLTRGEAVTSLDLARLAAGALRAAGTATAQVAERTTGLRADEPPEPTGLRGAYVVLVADHALDPGSDAPMQRAREAGARGLDDAALTGAVLAQQALHEVLDARPRRDRALALADAAVESWPDGATPLAVRGFAWHTFGVSSGRSGSLDAIAQALSLRDDAALYVLRARVALTQGAVDLARSSATSALAKAPQWGSAALLVAALDAAPASDAGPGDRCAALGAARESWTDDALLLCRGSQSAPAAERTAAATRLRDSSRDPVRLAYAAAHGAPDVLARVRPEARSEFALWLRVLGRSDLVRELADAGLAPSP